MRHLMTVRAPVRCRAGLWWAHSFRPSQRSGLLQTFNVAMLRRRQCSHCIIVISFSSGQERLHACIHTPCYCLHDKDFHLFGTCAWGGLAAERLGLQLQEELQLKEPQKDTLGSEGKAILGTLEPLRLRCLSAVGQLLVRLCPYISSNRKLLFALIMLSRLAAGSLSLQAPICGQWRIPWQPANHVPRIDAVQAHRHQLSINNWEIQLSSPATALQATFTGPELTLFRGQTSSPAVGELAADLETVAESCLVAESCASVRCAEVGHICHITPSCTPHITPSCTRHISPSCCLSAKRCHGAGHAVGELKRWVMSSIVR